MAVDGFEGRQLVSGLFGDFRWHDLWSIATAAAACIHVCEPPDFPRWAVMKVPLLYHEIFISSAKLEQAAHGKNYERAFREMHNSRGRDGLTIYYGDVGGINDWRYPYMLGIDNKQRHVAQKESIFDDIKSNFVNVEV